MARFTETVTCRGCDRPVVVSVKGPKGRAQHEDPPCSWWATPSNEKGLAMVRDAERKHRARARGN